MDYDEFNALCRDCRSLPWLEPSAKTQKSDQGLYPSLSEKSFIDPMGKNFFASFAQKRLSSGRAVTKPGSSVCMRPGRRHLCSAQKEILRFGNFPIFQSSRLTNHIPVYRGFRAISKRTRVRGWYALKSGFRPMFMRVGTVVRIEKQSKQSKQSDGDGRCTGAARTRIDTNQH